MKFSYKIDGDGIWLSKSELEEWRDNHRKMAIGFSKSKVIDMAMFYEGSADTLSDILHAFEETDNE